jgi:hypothetical protein
MRRGGPRVCAASSGHPGQGAILIAQVPAHPRVARCPTTAYGGAWAAGSAVSSLAAVPVARPRIELGSSDGSPRTVGDVDSAFDKARAAPNGRFASRGASIRFRATAAIQLSCRPAVRRSHPAAPTLPRATLRTCLRHGASDVHVDPKPRKWRVNSLSTLPGRAERRATGLTLQYSSAIPSPTCG